MKKMLIVGNWKLNHNKKTIYTFLYHLNKFFLKKETISDLEISIAPPLIYLESANNIIQNLKGNISLTAQNIDSNIKGSFTGETSIAMLKDIDNIKYVIVGHSERRLYHHETNVVISKKFALVKQFKLCPILCIGETKEEKNLNKSKDICQEQIDTIFTLLGNNAFEKSIIAYEPIWAIGSGISASVEYIQYMHNFIRNYIEHYNKKTAKKLIIQYGGSVNQNNVKEIFSKKDVNGALIGSSSLNYNHFIEIINCLQEQVIQH